jgi:hypothetical protein
MGRSILKTNPKFELVAAQTIPSEVELYKRIARLQQNEFELQVELRRVRQLLDQAYDEKQIFCKKQKI